MGAGKAKGKTTGTRAKQTAGESKEKTMEEEAREEPAVGEGARMEQRSQGREESWWRLGR